MNKRQSKSSSASPTKKAKPSVEAGSGEFPNAEVHITSWNINGIRACIKRPNLEEFAGRSEYDILCLNETKLQDPMVPEFRDKFPQFPYQYWSCSQTKKGYSGVAILSKANPISVSYGIGIAEHDDEGRVITAEYKNFFVVATYIPNAGQKLERLPYRTKRWDPAFRNYLKSLENRGKGVIWLGDLNVVHRDNDIYNMKGKDKSAGCTPEERKEFSRSLDDGLVDSFRHLYPNARKYSWYSQKNPRAKTENMGWRLDYIVVSQSLISSVRDSLIHDTFEGSDHHPVEIVLTNN